MNKLTRKILALVLFPLLLMAHPIVWAEPSPKPNVVIFLADDLGFADVGFKGSPINTPNIDRLAREGVELTRFYATPSCSPSRAALMTGRDPFKLGIAYATVMPWSNNGIHPEEHFMPESFKAAGYQTAIIGKWHLGHAQESYHPNQRGFDHFYGHLLTEVGFYPPFSCQNGKDFQCNGKSIDDEGYETFMLADEASRWIKSRDKNKPVFLYIPVLAPHTPLDAPEALKEKYKDLEDTRGPARSPVDTLSKFGKAFGRKSLRPLYAAVVDGMDQAIGRVLNTLEKEGIDDNTIVMFFSDNGGQMIYGAGGADNSPLRGSKGEVFEGGIRVVSLMRWPDRLKGGVKMAQMMTVMDVFPTLAAAAGIEVKAEKTLEGINMWQTLEKGEKVMRENWVYFTQESPTYGSFKVTVFNEEWKLVQLVEQDLEKTSIKNMLFKVGEDPTETTDLSESNPDVVKQLTKRIYDWRRQYIISGTRAQIVPPPGWRAPRDWATYPIPLDELQDEAAPGMAKKKAAVFLEKRLGDRGHLIYR